ncbi:hypothetical protein L2E82_36131 [Cichorium intybus]|uniref:Uncharacterized protein n=1 Tax=Cichorium intybus TaxID=13427 RepID=A0ACB9BR22_CICIN|nr:hypothetical protein L2E82_36131 [Cichorium intybus]
MSTLLHLIHGPIGCANGVTNQEPTSIPPLYLGSSSSTSQLQFLIWVFECCTGELKKMLTGPTGLHHEDQNLMYKDKARDSKSCLDAVGVKDRSKIVVLEDPISQEKRFLEMRKNAKMEKGAKSISDISFEVDRLAGQVSAIESVLSKGGKVAEKTLLNVIELLMNQLLKLDGITVDGDVKLQRKLQWGGHGLSICFWAVTLPLLINLLLLHFII